MKTVKIEVKNMDDLNGAYDTLIKLSNCPERISKQIVDTIHLDRPEDNCIHVMTYFLLLTVPDEAVTDGKN